MILDSSIKAKLKLSKTFSLFIRQNRPVQDQELFLASGPKRAHTVLRFPLEAVHSDICYDSTRSSSHQSKIAVIITESAMRLDKIASCCCTRQPKPVQESVMQPQCQFCGCGKTMQGEGVSSGESSLRLFGWTYVKRTDHAIDDRGGLTGCTMRLCHVSL